MKLMDALKLGASTIMELARRGRLEPAMLWTALKGAAKYKQALAAGDIAPDVTAAVRADACDGCRAVEIVSKPTVNAKGLYCGTPFIDNSDDPELRLRTCGCLVGVMVKGQLYPGAKVLVASEQCPQGKWGAVPPEAEC